MPRCHLLHIHAHVLVCIHNMYRVATEGAGIKWWVACSIMNICQLKVVVALVYTTKTHAHHHTHIRTAYDIFPHSTWCKIIRPLMVIYNIPATQVIRPNHKTLQSSSRRSQTDTLNRTQKCTSWQEQRRAHGHTHRPRARDGHLHRGAQLALHTYGAGFVKARYATVCRPELIPCNWRMGLTRPGMLECAAIFASVQRARAPRRGEQWESFQDFSNRAYILWGGGEHCRRFYDRRSQQVPRLQGSRGDN